MSFGDYEKGGRLWLHDPSGTDAFRVTKPVTYWKSLKVGTDAMGTLHDTHYTWLRFSGTTPHGVEPFEGERISLVFYTCPKWSEKFSVVLEARGCGIPVPEIFA